MDEFIDELLREDRACDVILPRIQVRQDQSYYWLVNVTTTIHDKTLESSVFL